jgi:serine phosphatase RsbU (regulator of sigma subunit)
LEAHLPFGIPSPAPYRAQHFDLQPGDRLVLYTDGMQEHQARSVDLAALVQDTASEHPREAVRTLTAAVTAACNGHLQDDATVLCLDWHGPDSSGRHAHAGADQPRCP